MRIEPFSLLLPKELPTKAISSFFEAAKYDIRQNLDNGLYSAPVADALYVYRISTQVSSHIGVIALNDISDFWDGKIKKHEKTLTRREEEYVTLLTEWTAVIKPVLLTYPSKPVITEWLLQFSTANTPIIDFEMEETGERHQLWSVMELSDLETLQTFFMELVDCVYIADGHHRTTTIANLSKVSEDRLGNLDFSRLFGAYFSEDQLDILGYHRLLTLPEDLSVDQLLGQLQNWFEVEQLPQARFPTAKREFLALTDAGTYRFTLKEEAERHLLDAHLLNEFVFSGVLGLRDIRSASSIQYVEGSKSLPELQQLAGPDRILFLLHPVTFEDLFYLSDMGLDLPPKSTWFEPRIKSGLAVYSLVNSNLV
jgi:uncharacterized protein (DUF1015 family)